MHIHGVLSAIFGWVVDIDPLILVIASEELVKLLFDDVTIGAQLARMMPPWPLITIGDSDPRP